jgi:hypothetical protein
MWGEVVRHPHIFPKPIKQTPNEHQETKNTENDSAVHNKKDNRGGRHTANKDNK